VAYIETEANIHVVNITEPGLSNAGDKNVVSNVSSNSSMLLNEPCAKLILVLLAGHSELHMVLFAFFCLSQESSSISSACPALHTYSQVAGTCWASE